jgi:hypothetical protein
VTANVEALLPGAPVLIDSRCCAKCDDIYRPGDRGTVIEAVGNHVLVDLTRSGKQISFRPVELILIPAEAMT